MSVKVVIDKRSLNKIKRDLGANSDFVVASMAYMCEGRVDEEWNSQSPSPPGEPPGIDTGTLKNSKNVRQVKHGVWELTYGTDYGSHLEYGTENDDGSQRMAARPFLLPAVEWTTDQVGRQGVLTKIVED